MLEIKNLYYVYQDGTKALNNINLNTDKGKIIGLIGANGSGKSTLFLNMMGVLKPKEGSIIYKGERIKYNKKYLNEYRKEVNIVFQNPDQQLFYSSIYDDLAFPLRNLGVNEDEIKDRINKSLSLVNALELIDRPIHFLSYGQKKRIAIAGALVMDLDLLLMDEPTAGLDPLMTIQMKNIIREIAEEKTILISSHDMDLIYDICDYVYVLSKGSIIGQGKKAGVFSNSQMLEEAKLKKPWLIRIKEKFGLPLFENEEEFNLYNGEEII